MIDLKKNSAFTIMEFVFAIMIVMITITISAQLFVSLNKDFKILSSYLTSYIKGREVIDIISRDCRIAIRVLDSYGSYTTSDDCLVLKVPSIDKVDAIVNINKYFDHIIYRMSGGDLYKIVIPGPISSRSASNGILKKSIESIRLAHDDTLFSSIPHKSVIAHLTIWVSISETILGEDYRVNPGTTVKLMNYEWEFVR